MQTITFTVMYGASSYFYDLSFPLTVFVLLSREALLLPPSKVLLHCLLKPFSGRKITSEDRIPTSPLPHSHTEDPSYISVCEQQV